ncbi:MULTISPECIES: fimbrial biogenesis chaperone [Serratia]|nr:MULTISPECIES: molecular chaperone [Serratia]
MALSNDKMNTINRFYVRHVVMLFFCMLLPATLLADERQDGLRFSPMVLNYSQADNPSGKSVTISNHSQHVFLLKGSIRAMEAETGRNRKTEALSSDLVILPPLSRLEAGGEYTFRIRTVGNNLPKDRESAYIVSITAIPGITAQGTPPATGTLQIAVRMNIRLFYRPTGIPARNNSDVVKKLRFYGNGDRLSVDNPTPYFIHLNNVSINGKNVGQDIMDGFVSPKSTRDFPVKITAEGQISWVFGQEKNVHQATITHRQ